MANATRLVLVESAREIAASHRAFNNDLLRWKDLARDLVRRMQYWVYDPATNTFSPTKFSGYAAMDFQRYSAAREGNTTGVKFDSVITQRAITHALGGEAPRQDDDLAKALQEWAESIFEDYVVADIDHEKWRFVRLPVGGSGGLAALAGGWEE